MLISIGTIIVMEKDFTKDGEKFKSKVIDMNEGFVMIDYPTHIKTGKTAFFLDGTQLLVSFMNEDKNSYAFKTEVSGRLKSGVPMLKLTYPGDEQIIKIQRREFVRISTPIDVAVEREGVYSQYVADDISAGGISLIIPEGHSFIQDEQMSLLIVLPFTNDSIKYVKAEAKVIRTTNQDGKNTVSMKFTKLSSVERQQIIQFCFERQLKMRNEL